MPLVDAATGSDAGTDDDGTFTADATAAIPKLDAAFPPASETCGDGVVSDELEACDGQDFAGLSCTLLGFGDGDLKCDPRCRLDTTDCAGVEICHDGSDDDGDGLIDCDDDDCSETCSHSCSSAIALDPLQVRGPSAIWLDGTTHGHANELDAKCATNETGPEVVYEIVPTRDGVLEVELESLELLTVSVLSRCGERMQYDWGCTLASRSLRVPATEGEPRYVVVDGRSAQDEGAYRIRISEREQVCGDAHRDEPEACDDGNLDDDDGCSAECELETTEDEPNGSLEDATQLVRPFFGNIGSAKDRDFVQLDLDQDATQLRITVRDLGDGACDQTMDTVLSLLDASGEELASDDDGGPGQCSAISVPDASSGTYYLVVSRLQDSGNESFPYALDVEIEP